MKLPAAEPLKRSRSARSATIGLDPEETDERLWSGAADEGWRVEPAGRYSGSGKEGGWIYAAPSGARLHTREAALAHQVTPASAARFLLGSHGTLGTSPLAGLGIENPGCPLCGRGSMTAQRVRSGPKAGHQPRATRSVRPKLVLAAAAEGSMPAVRRLARGDQHQVPKFPLGLESTWWQTTRLVAVIPPIERMPTGST